jgi:Tfp pilus assembly protein PilX
MAQDKREKGYVLITVLLMLLVLTVIGMAAIGTSTVENLLSGNIRLREVNVSEADGCNEISTAVIERVVREMDTLGFGNLVTDANLATELRSGDFNPDGNTDVTCTTAGQNVNVDIDKMYIQRIAGSAMEFASGYEGLGKSGGSGIYGFYRINATGVDLANSSAVVGSIYRYMPK